MRRRDFIALSGAAMAAGSVGVRAQQGDRPKRIGILYSAAPDDPQLRVDREVLVQRLAQNGWTDGRNVNIEVRAASGNPDYFRKYAAELVGLGADVIVAYSPLGVFAVQDQSRAIPIVFISVGDPVGYGLIDSMAKPGGNVTGVANFGFAMGGKWVELLKEIAPGVERVLFIHHPDTVTKGYEAYLKSVSNAAPTFAIKVEEAFVRDENATEQAMSDFARQGNGGLIFPPDPFTVTHRNKIAALAQRLRLPAIYPFKTFVDSGGLASYGVDRREQDEKVAGFVNRILQGASPADIPAEGPTKFELAINLRAAKAMGLSVPPTLLARADVVIE